MAARKATKPEEQKKGKGGRPSTYTPEKAEAICALLAEGMSLRKICEMKEMPSKGCVLKWLAQQPEFVTQYTRAKQQGSEALAEEMLEIADDGTNDWMEMQDKEGNDTGAYKLNGEHVQRSRLRIETRKWLLAKLQPKKYGERVALDHDVPEDSPLAGLLGALGGNTLKPDDD